MTPRTWFISSGVFNYFEYVFGVWSVSKVLWMLPFLVRWHVNRGGMVLTRAAGWGGWNRWRHPVLLSLARTWDYSASHTSLSTKEKICHWFWGTSGYVALGNLWIRSLVVSLPGVPSPKKHILIDLSTTQIQKSQHLVSQCKYIGQGRS